MSISYTKLRDGSWGIRSTTSVTVGQTVTVQKKDGTKKTETVERILWTGDGIYIASIKATTTTASGTKRRSGNGLGPRTGCSCGSQEYGSKPTDCASCRFDQDDN